MATSNKPLHECRLGLVKGVAFKNVSENNGVYYGIQFSKLYRKDDEWKSSSSFGREDLPLLAKVADELHTQLYRDNGES